MKGRYDLTTRYPEIKKYILKQIDDGIYKEGIMLPPEKEFTELFQTSRMTVRRAFDDLIQDGVLIRKRGSGLFLSPKKIEKTLLSISTQHDEDIRKLFKNISIKLIDFKTVNSHYIVRNELGIEDEDAYQIKRIQLGDNHPIVYENIFLPARYFSKIKKKDCLLSMREITKNHFYLKDRTFKRHITVESALATKNLSSLLQIPVNSPVLKLRIVIEDINGQLCFCGINTYSGDNFNFYTG